MAVNRYDEAAYAAPYISQYVPIPFDTLYTVGKAYNDAVDKTLNDFSTALTSYRKFTSPSTVDTQRWYDLTVNPATELATEMASNPEILRTPEGRRRIQNFINTRPYAELSQLEQSRDNMLQRQQNVSKLVANGKYYGPWHNLDMSQYDTSRQGVFSNINVTPYASAQELVSPYVKDLKDSYMGTQGGFDYYGVSPETVANTVNANMNALMTTPQATEYMRQLINAGYSVEDAQQIFGNYLLNAASSYVRQNRKANPFATLQYQDSLIRGRWADPNNPQNKKNKNSQGADLQTLTESIQTDGLINYSNARADFIATQPGYAQAVTDYNSEDPEIKQRGEKALQQLNAANSTPQQLFKKVLRQYGATDDRGNILTNVGLQAATSEVLNRFSTPIQGKYAELLLNTLPGISTDTQTTPLGKHKTISSGANFDLATNAVARIAGYTNLDTSAQLKFLNYLKGGSFNNAIVLGNERILTVPTLDASGNPSTLNLQTISVAIPESQISACGLTNVDMQKIGATAISAGGSTTYTERNNTTLSGEYDNDDAESNYEKISRSGGVSTSHKQSTGYYIVTLVSEVPISGTGAEFLNQSALRMNTSSTMYNPMYQVVQENAFPNILTDEE